MADQINWSNIRKGRDAATKLLPKITKLPIVKSSRQIISDILKDGDAILDIGANDRNLERFLNSIDRNVAYLSYDVDKDMPHDYYDLTDVNRKFDLVAVLEVIEHLKPADVLSLIEKAHKLLNPSGHIVISTPNVCHPVRFWRDCTHITPFRYDELVGMLISVGFHNCKAYRIGNLNLRNRFRYWRYRPLLRLLDIDFATGVVVVGQVNKL